MSGDTYAKRDESAHRVRTFFEDSGGNGQRVLMYAGFTDQLELAKASPLAQALQADFRLIFADHRGQGRSDKPHEVASYELTTRVGHEGAARAAAEIPGAVFLSLPGHTHFSAERVADELLPHVVELFRAAAP
jgi:alpha-beta hydrolase superfamily lysophospholipase